MNLKYSTSNRQWYGGDWWHLACNRTTAKPDCCHIWS